MKQKAETNNYTASDIKNMPIAQFTATAIKYPHYDQWLDKKAYKEVFNRFSGI